MGGRAAVAALRFTAGRSKQNPTTWPHCVETGTEFSHGLPERVEGGAAVEFGSNPREVAAQRVKR